MAVLRVVLFVFGYSASIIVIARFVPVVRERRLRWLVVHHLGVAAIVVGWATTGDAPAVVVNSSWLVVSSVWYAVGGRREESGSRRFASEMSVRNAAPEDREAAAAVLVDAFFSDPLSVWLVPDGGARRRFHQGIFRAAFDDALAGGELRVADEGDGIRGVAVWYPPGREMNPSGSDMEAARRALSPADLDRLSTMRRLMAEHHPNEPHFYLWLMAVLRTHHQRGIGGSLLTPVLTMCDQQSTPAYLEATCDDNRRLYERYGFEPVRAISLPDGPSLSAMWRVPRGTT